MKHINKAALYLLLKSKDTIVNLIGIAIFSILLCVGIYFGVLGHKESSELVLILYILLIGSTMIVANSMIVDLSVKDRLSNRLEFFLASKVSFRELIISYTVQMLRLASVVPFFLFIAFYYFLEFKHTFLEMSVLYITTVLLALSLIFTLNVLSFFAQKQKLFKNMIFFGAFFLIYMSGMFSGEIVATVQKTGFNLIYIIIGINFVVALSIGGLGMRKLQSVNNEILITQRGEWA